MAKQYKLDVEIKTETDLKEAISQLERLKQLRDQLKGKVTLFKDDDLKSISDAVVEQDKLSDSTNKLKKRVDELQKARDRLAKSQSAEGKNLAEINAQITEQNKKNREDARNKVQLASAYDRLSRQLEQNKKKVKDLVAAGKELSASDKQLIKDTQNLDAKLKQIDRTVGEGRRSVGLYKESIKEAFQETGIFSGQLGNMINVFNRVARSQDEAAKSSGKFSKSLRLGIAGAAVAVAALIKGLLEVNQTLKDNIEIVTAQLKDLVSTGNEYERLARATIQWRDTLLSLRFAMNFANREEQDFAEISNDVTLGFKERNAALLESIRFSENRAELAVAIAKGELDLANQAVKAAKSNRLSGKEDVALREQQFEAQQKLLDAEDELDDLGRQNAARQRARFQEQLIQELDLIQSKRKSSTAQLEIARGQLQDEKIQLEVRRKIAADLLAAQQKTFNSQIKLLEKNTGIQIDQADLLATQDNVLLGKKIRGLNLSAALTDKLAEIVKKAQDAEVEGKKNVAKLDEESLKRLQKLNQINREISLMQMEDRVKDGEVLQDRIKEELDKTNEEIFEKGKAFDAKTLKQREYQFAKLDSLAIQLFGKRQELLKEQAANDIKNIEDSVADEKIKAAEIKKINAKLKIDLENLDIEQLEKEKILNKERVEDNKRVAKEQLRIAIEQSDFVVGKIGEALDKRSEKNLKRIDDESAKQQKAQELQESRAERGLENELEFQQKRAAELERQREAEHKKQERREKRLAFYNLLSSYAKENPNTALGRAAKDMAISEAISLAFAAEGGMVEDISDKTVLSRGSLSKSHSSGDRLVVTSPKEGILTEREVASLGGKQGFYQLKDALNSGLNNDILFPRVPQFAHASSGFESGETVRLLKRLEKAINDKPVSLSNIDNVGDVITEKTEQGIKYVRKIVSRKPRLRR